MKTIDLNTWKRKSHFDFFNTFADPFFGITTTVELSKSQAVCRLNEQSVYLYYLHAALLATNAIEAFKYRIKDNTVVLYDDIHMSATVLKPDQTFAFSFIPFASDFTTFSKAAIEENKRVKQAEGIGLNADTARLDTIHCSALPWIDFNGLKHPSHGTHPGSCPKISFGQFKSDHKKTTMSVAVHAHHGLMDGLHIGLWVSAFQDFLNRDSD